MNKLTLDEWLDKVIEDKKAQLRAIKKREAYALSMVKKSERAVKRLRRSMRRGRA